MAVGLRLAAVTFHDVLEGVSLFGDLQERKEGVKRCTNKIDFLN